MKINGFGSRAFCVGLTVALLAGCGGSRISSPLPAPATNGSRQHPLTSNGYESLYSFKGSPDGAYPAAGVLAVNGTLYGTTIYGGTGCTSSSIGGCGTVFRATPSGGEAVIYAFKGAPDATYPTFALVDMDGTLYGTTQTGGTYDHGTVFSVSTSGSEHVVYSFKGGSDGSTPFASLIAVNGQLYGTTEFGGSGCRAGCGTVFATTPSGGETVLHRFKGYPHDGAQPLGSLVAVNGMLYGTTWLGGGGPCADYQGCGTVFQVSASGKERVLHHFKGAPDGYNPEGGLVFKGGELYGTTLAGGSGTKCPGFGGCGTLFEISTSGTERVLHSFEGGRKSALPNGELLLLSKLLYGTAGGGTKCPPSEGCGTLFQISTSGKAHVLYRFNKHSVGRFPYGLLTAIDGALYGTTEEGGTYGRGTLFSFVP